MHSVAGLILCLALASCGTDDSTTETAAVAAPDRILNNGRILTVDEEFNIVEAIALDGDRILATGANDEIAALADPDPVGREAALVADTRSNAYLMFKEDDLGILEAGKLADLVVLDRDYLTVPAHEIKDIVPVMTMVGGEIVYGKL